MRRLIPVLPSIIAAVSAAAFKYEREVLEAPDILTNPLLRFGDGSTIHRHRSSEPDCKTFPGDDNWPSVGDWDALNKTLEGALIKTVPLAAPCHDGPYYNATECAFIQASYGNSTLQTADPTAMLATWTQGDTCLPTNDSSSPCTLGGYPVYAVNATTVKHIQSAVNFARNTNIRLVIKNTGHDFLGRSTGAGSLAIWTHNLKGFTYHSTYKSGNYTGPAATVGTGVQMYEMINHMAETNSTFVVPGGTTVGVYGGYVQGGGHSIISPLWGLGADQVLALNVVTADGRFLTATPDDNEDLLWAMSGGGPGNFGVLVSAVVKAHPSVPISTASIILDTSASSTNLTAEKYWEAIREFFAYVPQFVDDQIYGLVILTTSTPFTLLPSKRQEASESNYTASLGIIYPGRTEEQARALLAPFLSKLTSIGVTASAGWYSGPSYPGFFQGNPVGDGSGNSRHISRLIPRKHFEDEDLLSQTFGVIKDAVVAGYTLLGDIVAPTLEAAGYPNNSVLPAWRDAASHATFIDNLGYNYTAESLQEKHVAFEKQLQPLRDITPGSGAYMNEADLEEPDWQEAFYGINYPRLLSIKKKYDPKSVFYATTAVGSEGWKVITADGTPTQNGRLCRV